MPGEVNSRRGPGSGVRGPTAEERVLAEFDRELATALSVSPSADFEARVLRRVADDEAPPRWSHGWLAAAALLVLAVGLFFAVNRMSAPVDDGVAPQMAERQPDVRLPAPAHQEPPPAPKRQAYTADAPARKGPAYVSEPEVIVPLNQMEAVRRLVRAVNEGRLATLPEQPQGLMPPPAELRITPLVVEPIRMPTIDAAGEMASSPESRRSY